MDATLRPGRPEDANACGTIRRVQRHPNHACQEPGAVNASTPQRLDCVLKIRSYAQADYP
jgi:hypothetical protein